MNININKINYNEVLKLKLANLKLLVELINEDDRDEFFKRLWKANRR